MARQKRVLLVDEDKHGRDAMERALIRAGYYVVFARNVNVALRLIQKHPIDIVVLGLGLDAERDWSAVQLLTQCQPRPRLIVTGGVSREVDDPLTTSPDALLEKPLDLPLLIETVKRLAEAPIDPRERRWSPTPTTIKLESQRERNRQARRSFEELQRRERRWFQLRLVAAYTSIVLLIAILCGSSYVVLNHVQFEREHVSLAVGCIYVDVVGLLVAFWKSLIKP